MRSAGITLIELMVALAIGSFLMVGAFSVCLQSRATFRINESIARLQENARYVFDVIEPDIRMAGYWGLNSDSAAIVGRAGPADPVSPFAPARDCGRNWSVDLEAPIEGANNVFSFDCAAYGSAAPTADTLAVRRVAADSADAFAAGTLYLLSARGNEAALFAGHNPPAAMPAGSEVHALIVNGYYVSRNSTLDTAGNRVPSLRRKLLRGAAAGPTLVDEEVLPGVEDLQVQFGVDTDAADSAGRGTVDRYVNPDDAIFDEHAAAHNADLRILSVRIWLRLRSEQREAGVPADTGYAYADRTIPPLNDGFRRLVVSRTVFLRNARSPS